MSRLSGSWALITGASAGIGEACARRFAADGVHLILWARRIDRLESLAAELRGQTGVQVRVARVDVRDREDVGRASRTLFEEDFSLEILVNSAGLASGMEPFHASSPDDWDLMIDTNLKGLLNVTFAVLDKMIQRGRGHVVNIGSTAGHLTYPAGHVYNATKFAVRALTEAINLDVAGSPIRVSAVDPGYVRTEFSVVRFKGDVEKAEEVYRDYDPLTASDVADAVWWVANQPAHVNILNLVMVPTNRPNAYIIGRSD